MCLLSGCGINPTSVTPVKPSRTFDKLTCEQLETESTRITSEYERLRWSAKAGTKQQLAKLNGETLAVNDAIRINSCKLPSVRIPGDPMPETRNGYGN